MSETTITHRPLLKPLAAIAALALVPALAACGVAEARTVALVQSETASAADATEETSSDRATRQCFFARQVNGFRSVEDVDGQRVDEKVLIDVGAADTYEFELLRRCPALRFARSIVLDRVGPGRICDGLDVDLIVQDTLGPERCPVTMVRKLAPEEANARPGAK